MDLDSTSPPSSSRLPPPSTTPSMQVTNRVKRPNLLHLSNTGYNGSVDDSHNADQSDALLQSPLAPNPDAAAANFDSPAILSNGQPVTISVTKHKYEATINNYCFYTFCS